MVKIRLRRQGAKKRPFYRLVAIDERKRRDGRPLEFLGTFDPMLESGGINIKLEPIDAWIAKGAQLSEAAASLVAKARSAGAS
jgi:small subunit ribosomal protein S16